MNPAKEFINEYMTPEHGELLTGIYDKLLELGHHSHVIELDNHVELIGSIETSQITMMFWQTLTDSCRNMLLGYFVLPNDDATILQYKSLIELLTYLETTIESDTLLNLIDDNLVPIEQLLLWCDNLRPELRDDVEMACRDVMDTLINNITDAHELLSDVEATDVDELFTTRVTLLRKLLPHLSDDVVGVQLIRKGKITKVETMEQVIAKHNKLLYVIESLEDNPIPNFLSMVILCDIDIALINVELKRFINLLYDNVTLVSKYTHMVDITLDPTGELCKIINTI